MKPTIDLTMAHNLDYVQMVNTQVADHLFPNRTFASMMLKAYGELGEIVDGPRDPTEVADVIIMLMDHMSRIGGHVGQEVLLKLQKNLDRQWGETDSGVYRHVQPGDTFVTHEEC